MPSNGYLSIGIPIFPSVTGGAASQRRVGRRRTFQPSKEVAASIAEPRLSSDLPSKRTVRCDHRAAWVC